jgi:hypothetical protein
VGVDIIPLAGMLLALLIVLIIGGFILLFPLSRRLGQLMELRLNERSGTELPASDEIAEIRDLVEGLRSEVASLAERQAFTERLLESGPSPEEGGSPSP